MVKFLYPRGIVYVFENPTVGRVKVGMTGIGVNSVVDRLKDVNDMWLERKVTCQICGGRLVNVGGVVPDHVAVGKRCAGGSALPLERAVDLAEFHLERMKGRFPAVAGTEKGSLARRIRTLEARIARYRHYTRPGGEWQFRAAFHTEGVAEIESLAHKLLDGRRDKQAPFGEVFDCSVSEAMAAVETALSQLGVTESARRETALSVLGTVPSELSGGSIALGPPRGRV